MLRDCVLGLDCGTQSSKAVLYGPEGRALGRGAAPLAVSSPRPGWAEQDPAAWLDSAVDAVRAACATIDPLRIAAIGVAWQRESFVLVDAAGVPLRPGILWLDIRAAAEVEALGAEREALHRETGKPVDVTLTAPRMAWLRAHEPDLFRGEARWVDVGCWLLERLAGRRATCVAGADTSGLVALSGRCWSGPSLRAAGLEPRGLPELVEPGAVVGGLSAEAARATGLSAGIPVVAAGGDGQVLATALGALPGGAVCTLALGTSVVLGVPGREATITPFARTLPAAAPGGGYLHEAVLQSGTYLFRWLEERLLPGDAGGLAAWEEDARSIPPGSEGLVTVPHWWGTRFPHAEPAARGATLGWSDHHGRAHLYRSLLEGVAFELAACLDALLPEVPGARAESIAAAGGGARSGLWCAILADVLGRPIDVGEEPEPVALGAAAIAAAGAGVAGSVAEALRLLASPSRRTEPDPVRRARYAAIRRDVYAPLRASAVALSRALAATLR